MKGSAPVWLYAVLGVRIDPASPERGKEGRVQVMEVSPSFLDVEPGFGR